MGAVHAFKADHGAAMNHLSFHPLADIFPLMNGEDFSALAADVQTNGLREPIVLLAGSILDGRNRYRACEAVGVAPRFETYAGDDPTAYVISLNLRRRHLNESQRAMVGAKLANLRHGGDRRLDQEANLPLDPKPSVVLPVAKVADMLNVSERSIKAGRAVREHGVRELNHQVEAGVVSVSAAATVARLPEDIQHELTAEPEVIAPVAKAVRDSAPDQLIEALRPAAEKFAVRIMREEAKNRVVSPVERVVVETLPKVGSDFPDWTRSVEILATLKTDLPRLARVLPVLNDKYASLARAALPRLKEWIAELKIAAKEEVDE